MDIYDVLRFARDNQCSDVHITAGTSIAVRRFGKLNMLDSVPSIKESEDMILSMLTDEQVEYVKAGNDLDVAGMDGQNSRVRINVYHQRNHLASSIRLLNTVIPTFEELGMPPVIETFARLPRGLVLITGPTGSGKSTTLASMIDYINSTMAKHVITIEDPIEYVYKHRKAMIHQREVGADVSDFATALRSSLREDPDIILLGEMRDYETISAAVTAAETGHLVLSTLHTTSAAQTIERIIDGCPLNTQNTLRTQLANVLEGVITQQLLPLANGTGRVVATEVMLNNTAVGNLIRENKAHQIQTVLQASMATGMHTLNFSLAQLVKARLVTREDALKCSSSPVELDRMI